MMRAAATIALIVVLVLALLWAVQRRLIYFPSQVVAAPETLHPGIEPVTFDTEDGLQLEGWMITGPGTDGGTVLVFPGNAGNRSHRLPLAEALVDRGLGVLLVDYRGYGGNPGSPSEPGLAADARAALAYLRARPEVDPETLVYFGESLGAAVALGLAVTEPPAALVLRSPFTSLPDVGSVHYPFLPTSLLLRDRFDNWEAVAALEAPLLVIAGTADRIIPPEQSRQLFESAPQPKRLVMIDGADHNDLSLLAGEEMIDEIAGFLAEVIP